MKTILRSLALFAAMALLCAGCVGPRQGGEPADASETQEDMRGFAPDPFSIPLGAEERGE